MKQDKKVMMNHNLAKALMEAGMQHIDDAGVQHLSLGGLVGGLLGGAGDTNTPQSNFQAQQAATTTSNYQPMQAQAGQNVQAGYGQAQNLMGQQQNLANQLQQNALGQGPNPAQMALQNATGQNIAAQGALMAGQRGANANPAALARSIAMQGAATQQQAAGQGALMQAQQQLAAQSALAGQQQAMQQANLGQQGVQSGLYTGTGQLQNTQNANAIQNQSSANQINAQTAASNAQLQQAAQAARAKAGGGLLSGIAGALGGPLGSLGVQALQGLMSSGGGSGEGSGSALGNYGTPAGGGNIFGVSSNPTLAKGGRVPGPYMKDTGRPKVAPVNLPAHFSHIASIYHPELMNQGGVMDYTAGGDVPGQAKVSGDSAKNDTVPAMVSPGEVVLPRSVTMAKDAPSKAAEFMRHLHAKEDAQKGYAKVAATKKGKK